MIIQNHWLTNAFLLPDVVPIALKSQNTRWGTYYYFYCSVYIFKVMGAHWKHTRFVVQTIIRQSGAEGSKEGTFIMKSRELGLTSGEKPERETTGEVWSKNCQEGVRKVLIALIYLPVLRDMSPSLFSYSSTKFCLINDIYISQTQNSFWSAPFLMLLRSQAQS